MLGSIRFTRSWRLALLVASALGCTGADVNAPEPGVARLTIVGAPATAVVVGSSIQLSVAAQDAGGNALDAHLAVWASSDTQIVRVSSEGLATTVAPGRATITATLDRKSTSVDIVVKLVPVATVTVAPDDQLLYTGQTLTLAATLRDQGGNTLAGRQVVWSSSDTSRARVDDKGVVTAVSPGAVTIMATSEEKFGAARVAVLAPIIADWTAAAEWTTFQGNASHTGFVDATVDPQKFTELWSVTVLPYALTPVTAGDGQVFVSAATHYGPQQLNALDARTGVKTWTHDFGPISSVNPPAYGGGRVYVQTGGHDDSFLWSFDAAAGAKVSQTSYRNQWARYMAPVVLGAAVYFPGGSYGGMYAASTSDGTVKWFQEVNQYGNWTPAVRDGLVYAYTGSNAPKLTVVNAETGVLAYEIPDPRFEWNGWNMESSVALGSDQDAFATQAGRMVAFDLAGRTVKWEIASAFTGNVTVADGVLYVVNGKQLEARRESDGARLWAWAIPAGTPIGAVIATRNLLFVSTSTSSYAIDIATRQMVWSYAAGGHLALSSQGILFIAQASGELAAIAVR